MSPDESSMKELEAWEMDPYVLFGSSFPKDTEYTQVSFCLCYSTPLAKLLHYHGPCV